MRVPSAPLLSSLSLVAVAALCLMAPKAPEADEITLSDGRVVHGQVVEEGEDWLRVRTTKGLLTLDRARVDEVVREQLSISEAKGDLALRRGDYYQALEFYELARQEPDHSSRLDEKIREANETLERSEKRMFKALFDEAARLVERDERAEALEVYRSILERAPEGGPTNRRARRAIAYQHFIDAERALDRVQKRHAIESLRKAIEIDPEMAAPHIELATMLTEVNEDKQALEHYRQGLELLARAEAEKRETLYQDILPERYITDMARLTAVEIQRYRFQEAELLFQRGEKLKAAEKFLDMLDGNSGLLPEEQRNRLLTRIAEAYTDPQVGQALDREALLEKLDLVLELDPDFALAWFTKGRLYLETGDYQNALQAFNKTIQEDDSIENVYLNRARCYLRLDEPELARSDLRRELARNERREIFYELGQVGLRGLDYDDALENFNRSLERDEEWVPGLLGRAQVSRLKAVAADVPQRARRDLLVRADTDLDQVLALKPENTAAILEKGRIFKDRKQFQSAYEYFAQVIETLEAIEEPLPEDIALLTLAYVERGTVQNETNNKNQARADFLKAIEYDPDSALAYNWLGQIEEKLDQPEQAEEHYAKAIELDPDNPDYHLSLALLYHRRLKQFPQAVEHYRQYLDKGGTDMRVEGWIREASE